MAKILAGVGLAGCCAFGVLDATRASAAAPNYSFLLRLARGKTYVAATGGACGVEVWTSTATGLVTLIKKSTDGSDCGAPSVISYKCDPIAGSGGNGNIHCRRCLTEQNLCDSLFDEADQLQACAAGDFVAKGQRFTTFPVDSARVDTPCAALP